MSHSVTLELDFFGSVLTVVGSYTPGTPGKLTGPWEDSYPAEPSEFEVEDVLAGEVSVYEMMQCMQVVVNTSPIKHRDALTTLAEQCCETLDEAEPDDDYEPD